MQVKPDIMELPYEDREKPTGPHTVYLKDRGSCEYPKGRTITRGEWERQQREGWGVSDSV